MFGCCPAVSPGMLPTMWHCSGPYSMAASPAARWFGSTPKPLLVLYSKAFSGGLAAKAHASDQQLGCLPPWKCLKSHGGTTWTANVVAWGAPQECKSLQILVARVSFSVSGNRDAQQHSCHGILHEISFQLLLAALGSLVPVMRASCGCVLLVCS